jgi:hypothetical protein
MAIKVKALGSILDIGKDLPQLHIDIPFSCNNKE